MKGCEIVGQQRWDLLAADHEMQWCPRYLVGKMKRQKIRKNTYTLAGRTMLGFSYLMCRGWDRHLAANIVVSIIPSSMCCLSILSAGTAHWLVVALAVAVVGLIVGLVIIIFGRFVVVIILWLRLAFSSCMCTYRGGGCIPIIFANGCLGRSPSRWGNGGIACHQDFFGTRMHAVLNNKIE